MNQYEKLMKDNAIVIVGAIAVLGVLVGTAAAIRVHMRLRAWRERHRNPKQIIVTDVPV